MNKLWLSLMILLVASTAYCYPYDAKGFDMASTSTFSTDVSNLFTANRYYEISRTSHTMTCDLCGESTIYYTITKASVWKYDSVPPIMDVQFDEGLDNWIFISGFNYHIDCYKKFQKFLINLYKNKGKEIK